MQISEETMLEGEQSIAYDVSEQAPDDLSVIERLSDKADYIELIGLIFVSGVASVFCPPVAPFLGMGLWMEYKGVRAEIKARHQKPKTPKKDNLAMKW